MKSFKYFLFLLMISCGTTDLFPKKTLYFNENGESVSEQFFLKKWRTRENNLARWDSVRDGRRIAKLSHPKFENSTVSYNPLLRNIERITGRTFNDSTILLLEYKYLNDLCTRRWTNTWRSSTIADRKEFLDQIKALVENTHKNVVYLYFFEEGIALENDPASAEEYFFTDKNNFLRKSLFRNPTLCGSFALIKPNDQVLVRNGEARGTDVVQLLEPKTWSLFFDE